MSASQCFRCALEAARPAKRINIQSRSLIQCRTYADKADSTKPQAAGSELKSSRAGNTTLDKAIQQVKQQPKRASPPVAQPAQSAHLESLSQSFNENGRDLSQGKPIPPNVTAAFRTPYKHAAPHGVPVASLQLRSYSVRNLEFFADFAMRVAYYLKLPASGPAPLPRHVERWTMPRSNFVHKKSQENFERITLRRVVTIFDGHPDVVEVWLACLRKWQFYGVGMKANVWQFEGLDVAAKMDKQLQDIEKELDAKLANFGWNNSVAGQKSIQEMLLRQGGNVAGSPMMELRDDIKGAKNIDLFRDVQT